MAVHIGLTGGIGSGKSTVARILADLGALVVDSDAIAREVVEPGTEGLRQIAAEFGPAVFTVTGDLDRAALGRAVFSDQAALQRLNAIVHPLVRQRSAELRAAAAPGQVVVSDVPLLVEGGMQDSFDVVVVVEAPLELRLTRLAGRGLPEDEARARMANQADDEQRRAVADVVLLNDGDLDLLTGRVRQFWDGLDDPRTRSDAGLE